jgi:hypothetical protein
MGTVLVDGYLRGTWRMLRDGGSAVLVVEPDAPVGAAERAALEEEGDALLRFAASGADRRDVRVASNGAPPAEA